MDKEVLFWSRFNYSIASFCEDVLLEKDNLEDLLEAMMGPGIYQLFSTMQPCISFVLMNVDLLWMGSSAALCMVQQSKESEEQCHDLRKQCDELSKEVIRQSETNRSMNKKLIDSHAALRDREWYLQEKIAALEQQHALERNNARINSEEAVQTGINSSTGMNLVTPERASLSHLLDEEEESPRLVLQLGPSPLMQSSTPTLSSSTDHLSSWHSMPISMPLSGWNGSTHP